MASFFFFFPKNSPSHEISLASVPAGTFTVPLDRVSKLWYLAALLHVIFSGRDGKVNFFFFFPTVTSLILIPLAFFLAGTFSDSGETLFCFSFLPTFCSLPTHITVLSEACFQILLTASLQSLHRLHLPVPANAAECSVTYPLLSALLHRRCEIPETWQYPQTPEPLLHCSVLQEHLLCCPISLAYLLNFRPEPVCHIP